MVFPNIVAIEERICRDLKSIEAENRHLARAYFLLLYSIYFDNGKERVVRHNDIVVDVLIGRDARLPFPSGLTGQIIGKLMQSLDANPNIFAECLAQTDIELPVFAFSTFPALFGFFTSVEMTNRACLWAEGLAMVNCHDDVIYYVSMVILFSCFRFTEVLWFTCAKRIAQAKDFDSRVVKQSVSEAVIGCAPLISICVKRFLYSMLAGKRAAVVRAIASFLKITLTNWIEYDGFGALFEKGPELSEYVNRATDSTFFLLGSLMVFDCPRLVTLPSYVGLCEFPSETLVLSHLDIKMIVKAFSPCGRYFEMFDTLAESVGELEEGQFAPMVLDLFLPAEKQTRVSLFDLPDNESIVLQDDAVMEMAYCQGLGLGTAEYQCYRCKADIKHYEEMLKAQELVFTRKEELLQAQLIRDLLLKLRNACFECHLNKRVVGHPILKGMTLFKAVPMVIDGCPDMERMLLPTVLALVSNRSATLQIPENVLKRFEALAKSRTQESWIDAGEAGQCEAVVSLMPGMYMAPKLSAGQLIRMVSAALGLIRVICEHLYHDDTLEQHKSSLIKAVLISSGSKELLHIVLYSEKVIFRHKEFLDSLNRETLEDWTLLLKAMWEVLACDSVLLASCMRLSQDEYADGHSRRTTL